jgi:hypothetical protein
MLLTVTSTNLRRCESLDAVIVGAGAAGVGTGVVLEDLGLDSYAILDREAVGASFRGWPDEMQLITPSFPSNSFGCRDLNAVTTDTSPAFALDSEHPSGEAYAEYLDGVVEFYDLPVRTGVDEESVQRHHDEFMLHTSTGVIKVNTSSGRPDSSGSQTTSRSRVRAAVFITLGSGRGTRSPTSASTTRS